MRFHIITYGCQMNVYDSGLVRSLLEKDGLTPAGSLEEADILLVNTCSVRRHAERRALGRINSFGRLRSKNRSVRIGVLGCMAKRYGADLLQETPVDFVVGPDNYRVLPDLIRNGGRAALVEENPLERYSGCFSTHRRGPCAFVAIMRGCDNFCSYCVVPYLRGRERSRDHLDIAEEIDSLTSRGVKDITLLGQNVNSYSDGELDFPGLLTRLCELTEIERLRFTTSHPKDITPELLRIMGSQSRVCNWLHLPAQSGSNRILRMMNRNYTREEYLELVASARESIPELSVTTDIMVGFPSESEDEFLETLDLVERVRFDFAYMFMYSTREGTRAAELKGPSVDVGKKRLQRVIDLQNGITRAKNELLVGKKVEILVEGRCKKGDYSGYGKTRNNKVVLIRGPALMGEVVQAKVLGLSGWTPWGERVNA